MMGRGWGRLALVALVPVVVVLLAAPAVGRHNFSMLKVSPELGVPGAEVSVSGFSYPVSAKVSIRFNSLNGPVLAELEPTANQDISGTVRIPPDTAPGRYVLYALQYDGAGKVNRIPGRAAVVVSGPGAPSGTPDGLELERRPSTLARDEGPSGAHLALVALGAFAVAGVLALGASRLVPPRRTAS